MSSEREISDKIVDIMKIQTIFINEHFPSFSEDNKVKLINNNMNLIFQSKPIPSMKDKMKQFQQLQTMMKK